MATLAELSQQPLQTLLGNYWVTKADGTPDYARMGSTEFFNTLPEEIRREYVAQRAGAQFRDAQIMQDARGVIGDKWINKADGTPDYAAMGTEAFFNTLDANQRTQYTNAKLGQTFQALGSGVTTELLPVGHAQVGSEQNWEWDVSKDMNDPQLLALARGDSADQAKLLEMVGRERAHSLINQVAMNGGYTRQLGQIQYGASSTTNADTYGIADLAGPTRAAYEAAGIIVNGKWAKEMDASGQWVPRAGFSATTTTPPGTTPPGTTPPGAPPSSTSPIAPTPTEAGAPAITPYKAPVAPDTPTYKTPERGAYSKTPFDFFNDEGYKFQLAEGTKGIENSAAARGNLQSGNTLKSLAKFQTGLAAQEYGAANDRYNTDRNFYENQYVGDRNFGRGTFENDRNFDLSKYQDERNFGRSTYENDRNFGRGTFESDRSYLNNNRIDARNFDYAAAIGDRNFNYARDLDNRNFEYQAGTGDRAYNTNTLMQLAGMGLGATNGSSTLASELAKLLSGNTMLGAGAGATATVGGANNMSNLLTQILQYLSINNAVNNAKTP